MADRFYVNCPLAPGPVVVSGPEAHHLATVCRLRQGDRVCLFNGDGHEYPAEVRETTRRSVALEVLSVETPAREVGFRLEIAAPLPKGDRAVFLLEKLTELGATAFVPLHTRRSVVHPQEGKLDKLERHVIEASKQCGRNVLLRVTPLTEWSSYLDHPDLPQVRILAHPGGAPITDPGSWIAESGGVAFAVGPEGGFTEDEVEQGRRHGWQVVSLGPRTLRVETAALLLAVWAAIGQQGQEQS
jgi:16S rRNA (uracil1498-N3)-methyltransferase